MTDKPKMDFTKLKSRKQSKPNKPKTQKVYKEVKQPGEEGRGDEKPKAKKPGRRSWKKPGVEYRRMSFTLEEETIRKLKELLVTKFYDKYSAQDELIDSVLRDFIKKHS